MAKRDLVRKRVPVGLIGIRNCLLIILAFAVLLSLAELIAKGHDKTVRSVMTYEESSYVTYFCYEKSSFDELASTASTREHMISTGIDMSSIQKLDYPLIYNVNTTAVYDDDTVNIVVIGDSFVWGHGTTNRNTLFWRILERKLRSEGYNCRVIAVGMAGADAYEEIEWLTKTDLMEKLEPDLVIFGYVFNDAMPDAPDACDMEYSDWARTFSFLSPVSQVWPSLYSRLLDYFEAHTIMNKKYGTPNKDLYWTPLVGDTLEKYQTEFVEPLDRFASEKSLPCVVMSLPNRPASAMLKNLYQPLEGIFKDTSVYCYNALDAFNKWYKKNKDAANLYANEHNMHPGNATHKFYADYIVEFLKNDFPEVIGQPVCENLNSRVVSVNDATPSQIDLETVAASENGTEFTFLYPDASVPYRYHVYDIPCYALTYPLGKDYLKINFENPVDISSVEIVTEAVKTADDDFALYYTAVDEKKGYDDDRMHEMPLSNAVSWSGEIRLVTSLCIHSPQQGKISVNVAGKVSN